MQGAPINTERRRLVAGGVGVFAASSLGAFVHPAWAQAKPLPQYVAWKNADSMIVHSPNTLETMRAVLARSLITSEADLFIRNNVTPPSESIVADRDAWEVVFEGVAGPRTMKLAELKAMGKTDLTMVLQCSGNGRAYFPHKPSGTQWTVGAAGCVTWGGVPLKRVVAALGGVRSGMVYLTGTGGETIPPGVDPKTVMVERSVPLSAVEDAMLAWELNGNAMSLAYGAPLRLIVPGYTGVNNVKYVKRIAFTPQQTDARIQAGRYRMVPMGGKANPSQPSVWQMPIKSWINLPAPDGGPVPAGSVWIQGVAFGGAAPAATVEVSIDGGKTWQRAHLAGPDLGRYAWRQFVLPVRLKAGTYVLASRATAANGSVQPEQRVENAAGYNNNSWLDHAFRITVV